MNQLLRSALAAWRENRTLMEQRAEGSSELITLHSRTEENTTVQTHIVFVKPKSKFLDPKSN